MFMDSGDFAVKRFTLEMKKNFFKIELLKIKTIFLNYAKFRLVYQNQELLKCRGPFYAKKPKLNPGFEIGTIS